MAISHCDAAAGRPGEREHFSYLGSTCNTPDQATNHRGRLFALGQTGDRGASSEAGARRKPRDRDKHDTSGT